MSLLICQKLRRSQLISIFNFIVLITVIFAYLTTIPPHPHPRVRPLSFLYKLVDLGGEVADMDLSARMSWYDSRFTEFKPRFGNKIYTEMDKIWHPNLFISNQILDAK